MECETVVSLWLAEGYMEIYKPTLILVHVSPKGLRWRLCLNFRFQLVQQRLLCIACAATQAPAPLRILSWKAIADGSVIREKLGVLVFLWLKVPIPVFRIGPDPLASSLIKGRDPIKAQSQSHSVTELHKALLVQ